MQSNRENKAPFRWRNERLKRQTTTGPESGRVNLLSVGWEGEGKRGKVSLPSFPQQVDHSGPNIKIVAHIKVLLSQENVKNILIVAHFTEVSKSNIILDICP